MRVCCVVEGEAEFYSVPVLISRLGHIHIKTLHCKGGNNDELELRSLVRAKVVPRVKGLIEKQPDKILIIIDREGRDQCPGVLAEQCREVLREELHPDHVARIGIVISDRTFESILFADYELLDKLTIHDGTASQQMGPTLDGKKPTSLLARCLVKNGRYDKILHGSALAGDMRLDSEQVRARSRCLRKLIKELATN